MADPPIEAKPIMDQRLGHGTQYAAANAARKGGG